MPPTTQRRKHAYLNRANYRTRRLSLDLDDQKAATWRGLAIDLGGSLEQRLRPVDLAARFGWPLRHSSAAEPKGTFLS